MISISAITGILASRTTVATLMPFVVNNGPGFENPNITTMPFLVDNGPGFENPNITTMPFTMNRV